MKLTKYGQREWFLLMMPLVLLGALALGADKLTTGWWVAFCAYMPVLLFTLWFFRDPERPTPTALGLFISPADGIVADITPIGPESRIKRDGVQIGVFMNVFSVHVNRAACEGIVTSIEHKLGSFLDVRKPESYELNESTTICMDYEHNGETYPVVMRQISGLVARHIITDVVPGQLLRRGERFGMIKFGSRVELLLPKELVGEVPVEIGQPAFAGKTVLAKQPAGDAE